MIPQYSDHEYHAKSNISKISVKFSEMPSTNILAQDQSSPEQAAIDRGNNIIPMVTAWDCLMVRLF